MDADSSNCTIWLNLVSGSTAENAWDSNGANSWDNGTHGNWWDDYTGSDINLQDGFGDTPYPIPGGTGAQDNWPLMEMPGTDSIAPIIDQPAGAAYEARTIGHNLTWHPIEVNAGSYVLYRNVAVIKSDAWHGSPLVFNIDGLDPGSYNFTLKVTHTFGHWSNSTVWVTVVDTTSPTIDQSGDFEYQEGDAGKTITWLPSDLYPAHYSLYRDGVPLESDIPWTGGAITITIDTSAVGVYSYTIVVYDQSGNWVRDTVMITIKAAPVVPSESENGTESDTKELSAGSLGFTASLFLVLGVVLSVLHVRSRRKLR